MKLMDEKGRLFGKLNIFDLVIILVVLAGIIGMATRLLLPGVEEDQLKTATYTAEFKELKECFETAYSVGDTLYEDGVMLGTVTAVEVKPAVTAEMLPDGSYQMVEHPLYLDITLTFTTDRFHADGGYRVDSQSLLAGTSHAISNGFAKATGVIREVVIE